MNLFSNILTSFNSLSPLSHTSDLARHRNYKFLAGPLRQAPLHNFPSFADLNNQGYVPLQNILLEHPKIVSTENEKYYGEKRKEKYPSY